MKEGGSRGDAPRLPALFFALLFGVTAGLFTIAVSGLEPKFAFAAAAGLVGVVGFLALGARGKGLALLALFVFGISLKLNKTLFLEESSLWQYVPFAGGAAGITLGANDFAAALLLIGALRRRAIQAVWPIVSGPLLFMAAGLASLHNAADPALVGFELSRQALLLLSLLTAMNLSEAQLRTALRLLALSIVLQGAIACTQFVTNATLGLGFLGEQDLVQEEIDFQYQPRAVGTIGHSNILSYFFEIGLPLMLALLMSTRSALDRLICLAAIGAGLAGVMATLSRAAWIAVPVTMLPVFLHYQARNLLRLRSAVYGVGAAILGSAALAAAWPTISERIFADDAGSTDARAPLNRAALSVIEQFPFFGVGLNNLANSFPLYDLTHNTRVFGPINHVVHNLYLLVMAEVGLVGFLAFLWSLIGAVLVGLWLRRSPDPLAQAIGVGGAAGLFAHMIHGLFDPGFKLSLPMSTMIAVQSGLIGAAWLRHRRASVKGRPGDRPLDPARDKSLEPVY